tara:strand:+ start:51 stop:794 length:744 start_codon:yes stop_codon:yes gene_type:complete
MEIPKIGIQSVGINRIEVPNIHYYVPHTQTVPFILNIGSPIVNMPGCVKFHPDAADNRETPNLKEEDSNGTKVLCDGEYPMYDAMDYTPEDLLILTETPPPKVEPPPEIDPPEVPPTGDLGNKEIECPAPNQPRVGDLSQAGDEKVVGHEIQGTTCVVLYEPTTTVEKFLPSTNQVSTTAAIAVIATASAAATPILLRLIKPVIKKLTTTIQKKLGKEPPKLSRSEIQANKYREKKGLPPVKRPKKS